MTLAAGSPRPPQSVDDLAPYFRPGVYVRKE